MLAYKLLKEERRKFLALTGLTLKEFKALLPSFTEAYRRKYASRRTLAGKRRKRQVGGGRRGRLETAEQKLLFILVYLKAYPLQVVMGELFGMNQSAANQWIHRLLPVLRDALADVGVRPEREGRKFAQAERGHAEPADYIIDGTERRRQRPKSPEKQALHYSGKKKLHSDKNVVIVQTRSRRVGYLSPTHAGKTHDKKVADAERIAYPRRAVLHKDTGFQGYEPAVRQTRQVKKSRAAKS
jgi:hypothetical protein